MSIASFISGLISSFVCRIPCVGRLAAVPAAIGGLFGFPGGVSSPRDCDTKGLVMAGWALSIIALAVSTLNVEATEHAMNRLTGPEKSMPSATGY